ncbi:hypothetical protein AGMMS49593_00220 [Endomicrobiia bacterium]|nr:hypothetical protein AGMMS49593_00220 [Endomicrobiia bacterium]
MKEKNNCPHCRKEDPLSKTDRLLCLHKSSDSSTNGQWTPTFSSKYYEVDNALDRNTANDYRTAITNAKSPEEAERIEAAFATRFAAAEAFLTTAHSYFVRDTDDADDAHVEDDEDDDSIFDSLIWD